MLCHIPAKLVQAVHSASWRLPLTAALLLPCLGCAKRVVDPNPVPLSPAPYGFQSSQATGVPQAAAANVGGVPASQVSSQGSPSESRYHEVVKGDTLTSIAAKYGTTVQKLQSANGLDADAVIKIGQLLFIP